MWGLGSWSRVAKQPVYRYSPLMYDKLPDFILTVTCPAATGVVAAITGYLAGRQCYIVEMAQFDDEITGNFFCRIVLRPDTKLSPDIEAIRSDFDAIATEHSMDWRIVNTSRKTKVMIMVSKADHCLADLLYRVQKKELHVEITAVISNHPDLRSMVEREGIRFILLPMTPDNRAEQEQRLFEVFEETESELLILARYMQILSNDICRKLGGRCINIHHSFLPGFKGARPYHQAFERGVKLIGATAHYVTADLDEGPIIEQVVEHVDHTQQPKQLIATGRDMENRALARAVRYHTERRVFIDNNKTVIFK